MSVRNTQANYEFEYKELQSAMELLEQENDYFIEIEEVLEIKHGDC